MESNRIKNLDEVDLNSANWQLMATHRHCLGVSVRDVPCMSFALRKDKFLTAKLNKKGEELLLSVGDTYYPYLCIEQGIVGLAACDVGPVLVRNGGMAGIMKEIKKFNPDILVKHMMIVKVDAEYKKLQGIDFVIIPMSEKTKQELLLHGFEYIRRHLLGINAYNKPLSDNPPAKKK